jgi:hypothetical protein
MIDPLAPYRRNKTTVTEPPKETAGYVAFGGKDRVERLKIQFAKERTHAPSYLHLQNLSYDGEHGTSCVLMFDFMCVLIRGKNLQGLVTALALGTVDFIQEFNPDLWPKPADNLPLIESIQIVQPDEAPSGAATEKTASS